MNYHNPELQQKLAGEYVLGTLRGRARSRFEQLMQRDVGLRDEVADWQTRMMPMADSLAAVIPPNRVWQNIRTRLGFQAVSRWSLIFWRNLGLISTTAAVMLAVYIAVVPMRTGTAGYIAVIADAQAKPGWLISSHNDTLTIKSLTPRTLSADRSLELWLLPDGGKPVAVGLLPLSGIKTALLTDAMKKVMAHSHTVAVSLEPAGGSPTGQPTGPVLYEAAMVVNT